MLDAPASPFDATDLEPSLRPFGRSRMLPRDAYTSERVLAFERERFFACSWTCVGREGDLAAGPDRPLLAGAGEGALLDLRRPGGRPRRHRRAAGGPGRR